MIRFKQSRPSIRRRHSMSVQRPPDGTFEVELDRAHHGGVIMKKLNAA